MIGSVLTTSLMVVIFVGASPIAASEVTCATKLTPWSCRLTSGEMIDLKPISSGDPPACENKPPIFTIYHYQWDPVKKFECKDYSVAGCQTDKGTNVFPIGDQETATFNTDTAGFYLHYTTSSEEGGRTLRVNLVCDQTKEKDFTAKGEVPAEGSKNFEVTLKSKYACPVPYVPPEGGSGISAGSVLLIIAAILVVVYLVVGVLVNIFIRHESGLNAIPNRQLWVSLPGLVQDGCLFVCNKARGRGQPGSQYGPM